MKATSPVRQSWIRFEADGLASRVQRGELLGDETRSAAHVEHPHAVGQAMRGKPAGLDRPYRQRLGSQSLQFRCSADIPVGIVTAGGPVRIVFH